MYSVGIVNVLCIVYPRERPYIYIDMYVCLCGTPDITPDHPVLFTPCPCLCVARCLCLCLCLCLGLYRCQCLCLYLLYSGSCAPCLCLCLCLYLCLSMPVGVSEEMRPKASSARSALSKEDCEQYAIEYDTM